MLPALIGGISSIGSLFGGGSPLSGGGQADTPSSATATGTFTSGGLSVTKADSTVIAALVLGGLILMMMMRRGRK